MIAAALIGAFVGSAVGAVAWPRLFSWLEHRRWMRDHSCNKCGRIVGDPFWKNDALFCVGCYMELNR